MKKYFYIEGYDTPGDIWSESIIDVLKKRKKIKKFIFLWKFPFEDHFFSDSPEKFMTNRLRHDLLEVGSTGIQFTEQPWVVTEAMNEDGQKFPDIYRVTITGKPGDDFFTIFNGSSIVVSEKALKVIKNVKNNSLEIIPFESEEVVKTILEDDIIEFTSEEKENILGEWQNTLNQITALKKPF